MEINITPEALELARQKQLQDKAALQGLMNDPDDPQNPVCISCQ